MTPKTTKCRLSHSTYKQQQQQQQSWRATGRNCTTFLSSGTESTVIIYRWGTAIRRCSASCDLLFFSFLPSFFLFLFFFLPKNSRGPFFAIRRILSITLGFLTACFGAERVIGISNSFIFPPSFSLPFLPPCPRFHPLHHEHSEIENLRVWRVFENRPGRHLQHCCG